MMKIINEEKELNFKNKSDFKIMLSKMKQLVDKLDSRIKTECESIESYKVIIPAIISDLKMQHAIELQNELDKKSISLVGIKDVKISNDQNNDGKPIISLNKKCVNCSQNPSLIISAFKMACLLYNSSPISWKGDKFERDNFTKMRIIHIQSVLDGELIDETLDYKTLIPPSITCYSDEKSEFKKRAKLETGKSTEYGSIYKSQDFNLKKKKLSLDESFSRPLDAHKTRSHVVSRKSLHYNQLNGKKSNFDLKLNATFML